MNGTGVLQRTERTAAWQSLLVYGAALLLLAASLLAGNGYRWGAIALLAFACAPWRALPANSLSLITGLYCAWLFVNAVVVTPAYTAEGIYRPLILLGGFACVAALGRYSSVQLFRAGVALLSVLVLIGLLQYFFGFWHLSLNPTRAAATFVTPNTFATAINLFLLPLAALYVTGRGSAKIYALALWLFAGLVASQSRGGMLALLAGLAFIAVSAGGPALWRERKPVAGLLAGFIVVWVAFAPVASLFGLIDRGDIDWGPTVDRWSGIEPGISVWARFEMYAVTTRLILDHPFTGAGANMFFYLFEAVKPHTFPFRDHAFTFAHNDYLQVWLEFGALGLALLTALAAASLLLAWRSSRRAPDDPLPLACGAALASCYAHALVDFPLYVTFTVMVTGGYLGALAAFSGDRRGVNSGTARVFEKAGAFVTVPVRWALAFAALAWLAQPVLAELASRRAVEELFAGRAEGGLYWQSVARRLEPRNAIHYWAEATIWRDQAEASGDRSLAARAHALFEEEIRVNPYEIAPYIELARLHRQYPNLFDRPKTAAEILKWTSKALELRPDSLFAHAEHARALAFAGRVTEAWRMVRAMQAWHPEAKLTRDLAAEFPATD